MAVSELTAAAISPVLAAPGTDRLGADAIDAEVLARFDATGPALIRYAQAFGLGADDAEDVVQDVFVALFRHLRLGRSRGNLAGWLFRVTHNLALKRRMRVVRLAARATNDEGLEERPDAAPTAEAEYARLERQRRLHAALDTLSAKDRQCVVLRHQGLRYRQIASTLGISLGGVAKSLSRSIARLAEVDEG